MARPTRILFIDDDPDALRQLEKIASVQEWTPFTRESAKGALEVVDAEHIDVVVSDHWMPGVSGIDFLAALRVERPQVVRILMSTGADREMARRAVLDGGVHAVVDKPWNIAALVSILKAAAMQARSLRIDARPDAAAAVRSFKR